jgi:fatty acid desaturase
MQSTPPDSSVQDAGEANLLHHAGVWVAFLLSFPVLAHIHYGLVLIPFVSLAFLQYLAGVIHEAAHWNFYRPDRRVNELAGSWGASFVFGYSLEAYREGHFKHHACKTFLQGGDGETTDYQTRDRKDMVRGILKDLFFVTAAKMVYFRLSPMFKRPAGPESETKEPDTSFRKIVLFSACLWGGLALASSVWAVALFWLSFLTLYPLSNRIRVYATHGDITKEDSMMNSETAVNVLSPVYERIFFGNRMMMYHYEHHLKPNLPFRKLEELARERHRAMAGEPDYKISVPSYMFVLRSFLYAPKQKPADISN